MPNCPHPYPSYDAAFVDCKIGEIPIVRNDDKPEAIKNRFDQYQQNIDKIMDTIIDNPNIKIHHIQTHGKPKKIQDSVLAAIK